MSPSGPSGRAAAARAPRAGGGAARARPAAQAARRRRRAGARARPAPCPRGTWPAHVAPGLRERVGRGLRVQAAPRRARVHADASPPAPRGRDASRSSVAARPSGLLRVVREPDALVVDERADRLQPRRDDGEPGHQVLEELVRHRELAVSRLRPVEDQPDVELAERVEHVGRAARARARARARRGRARRGAVARARPGRPSGSAARARRRPRRPRASRSSSSRPGPEAALVDRAHGAVRRARRRGDLRAARRVRGRRAAASRSRSRARSSRRSRR